MNARSLLRAAAVAASLFMLTSGARAADGLLAPGDAVLGPPIGKQQRPAVAAGGAGFLAVWEDERAVISGFVNTLQPLNGNGTDIYGMRLDANGNSLDPEPIVICNQGHNQSRPQVAWNGQTWLVVFVTQRPDWYFFDDIVGVRVAPDGTVLDPTPIQIRPEQNSPANYAGANPYVSSDGTNWIVVWEDFDPSSFKPNVKGTRVAPNGAVLDPNWPVLYQYTVAAFGPRDPRIEPGNGELLLIWRDATGSPLQGRRISKALVPLAAPFTITTSLGTFPPSLASDGNVWFVLTGTKAFRVGALGTVLDPNGITLPTAGTNPNNQPNRATYNGAAFAVSFNANNSPTFPNNSDLYLVRVSAAGTILDPTPIAYATSPADEWIPALSGSGGATQAVYVSRNSNPVTHEDVRSTFIAANGAVTPAVGVADGRPRQEYVHAITAGDVILAVFASRTQLSNRVMAQRFHADGTAIDAAPVEIRSAGPNTTFVPTAAWNGTNFCIAFVDPTLGVVAQRFDAALQAVDAQPIQLFASGTSAVVGANGGDFLVASTYIVSGDQSLLRAVRVRGTDGAVLDATPLALGGSYVERTRIESLGGSWLVVWNRRVTHDSPATTTLARFVDPTGALGAQIVLSGPGYGYRPDVAVTGDRALVVYVDDSTFNDDRIEGRLLAADGTLLGPEIAIADAAILQTFPTVSFDGFHFVTVWVDYRDTHWSSFQVEQLRGDLYAARVTVTAQVLDGHGVQLTNTVLPEDLPDLASVGTSTQVFYSGLGTAGTSPDVQRLSLIDVGAALPTAWSDLGGGLAGANGLPVLSGFGDLLPNTPVGIALENAAPSSTAWLVAGATTVNAPFFGGTLVPSPLVVIPLPVGANGALALQTSWPGAASGAKAYLQAWIADAGGPAGFAASNALSFQVP